MLAPDTVFSPLKKISVIIYIPYLVAFGFAFYAFTLRSGAESIYFLTLAMLIASALLIYSEFFYFLLAVKYYLQQKTNHKK